MLLRIPMICSFENLDRSIACLLSSASSVTSKGGYFRGARREVGADEVKIVLREIGDLWPERIKLENHS